eukprot:gnl/MRDRNA2_/MRDRNA2_17951_c0_seq1.p1 gnl/MRDRNA2_/MRDRNA2_17951_c0~~gnl/MRDRNA2_/MRDRNA2_17951_c0_seq1.p1  ORF type:complete len:456 (-),score=100.15 gnl/MRDRNA2_/MRDRNA2_17951_c0_seq1:147-1394(-)
MAPICPQWAESRVKATPVNDEHFICMGTKAPLCPAPQWKQDRGPITIATVQGSWIASGGAQIAVTGTEVYINRMPLTNHRVEMDDDGTVRSIGTLWQLMGWTNDGGIDWRCSSTRDNMESARSDVWTKKVAGDAAAAKEEERLALLGYAGSAADPLTRGIEGCLPGTTGAEMGYNQKKDAEDIALLCALVKQWREPDMCLVRPRSVVPDAVNRGQTGLGVELVHFIALSIKKNGFLKRVGQKGHDIPVLVREPSGSATREEAVRVWTERVKDEEAFPPVVASASEEIFTSLGNGHFFQALNLYNHQYHAVNDRSIQFTVGQDADLREALEVGVNSVVLKHETPKPVRIKISQLLNSKREFLWTLNKDGSVDVENMKENEEYCSQFEWLSKGMDAEQVNCLVRTHLGVKQSKRIQG